jgi:glutathione S-transferase
MTITLYHARGSRSLRVLWMLEEMGLDYGLKTMAFPPRITTPDFVNVNPTGTVPAFIDGDVAIFESVAVMEYLGAVHGPTPLVVTPGEAGYADYLQYLHYGEATLMAYVQAITRYGLFTPNPEIAKEQTELFLQRLDLVERKLEGETYLAAGRFTAADISVGYTLSLAAFLELTDQFPPRVAAYWEGLKARPAFKAAAHKA